ncbi:hypothetical protein F4604DRAFT_1685577 [Suillus subluteus]|nr:hypothetical protein F4604DRAFT_1685577 [Suillus subluteus]
MRLVKIGVLESGKLTECGHIRSKECNAAAVVFITSLIKAWNQGPIYVANAIEESLASVPSHARDDLERRLQGKLNLYMLVIVVIYISNYACRENLVKLHGDKNLNNLPVTDQSWTICRRLFYIEGSIVIFIAICVLFILPDLLHNTTWLTPEERALGISHPAEDGHGRIELEKKTIMQGLVLWDAVSDGKVSIYTMNTAGTNRKCDWIGNDSGRARESTLAAKCWIEQVSLRLPVVPARIRVLEYLEMLPIRYKQCNPPGMGDAVEAGNIDVE